MTEFGICTMPRSIRTTIELARASEECGFTYFGVGDGHFLYHEMYPVITAALLETTSIKVAPSTSNNVVRSWSVHASAARALHELCPGRFVLGLATGDGSVRSIGRKPQAWSALQEDVARIRDRAPLDLEIQCTASGLRGARAAGSCADTLVVGTGADAVAISNLADAARVSREAGPLTQPLGVWALILAVVVDAESDVPDVRNAMRLGAFATAHFAFASTFEGKNVPTEYQAAIREGLARYDYGSHGALAADNPNAQLFSDRPDVADYLVDRMCLIGTEAQLEDRLAALCRDARLDGVWLNAGSENTVRRLAAIRP